MVKGAPAQRRGLVALVGAVAATALLSFTSAFERTALSTYRDMARVLTYSTGATENAAWGRRTRPRSAAPSATATLSGTPPASPCASRSRA